SADAGRQGPSRAARGSISPKMSSTASPGGRPWLAAGSNMALLLSHPRAQNGMKLAPARHEAGYPRSHALRGNASGDAPRRVWNSPSPAWPRDAERPGGGSHAERGNQDGSFVPDGSFALCVGTRMALLFRIDPIKVSAPTARKLINAGRRQASSVPRPIFP